MMTMMRIAYFSKIVRTYSKNWKQSPITLTNPKFSFLISMTKVPFNFDYNVTFNVLDVVSEFYPALSEDERQTIAYEVVKNYDYSITFEDLLTPIRDAAADNGIFLEGKDGVKEEEDNIYVLNTPKSALFK